MKVMRMFQFLTLFLLCNLSGVSQEIMEQIEGWRKYVIDEEARYLGDTIIVKQAILIIEEAINSYNADVILSLLDDRRKKKDERVEFRDKKRNAISKYFMTIDSIHPSRNKNNIQERFFQVTDVTLSKRGSIIEAKLYMLFAASSFDKPERANNKNRSLDEDYSKPIKSRNPRRIKDTWVFENIEGEWKLVSSTKLLSILAKNESAK